MMLYKKAKSKKWSQEKLLEIIALLESELSYELSIADKFRLISLGGKDMPYKSDVELLEQASLLG